MRKKLLRLLRFAPIAAVLAAGVASAQTTGTIIGVVTDASTGKPVTGALVVATSPNLQGEQTAVTDASGSFRLSVLPPGSYKLAVQLEGYKPSERSDIVLRVDKTLRANLAIVPEAVQMEEQVVRTGVAPVINMGSTETGVVASKEFLASVPLPTVTVQQVAMIAPTATSDLGGIGFAGNQSLENNYILDGLSVSDPRWGNLGTDLLQHFVEQVDLKTGAFMPEYGRAAGGIVNIVTKSGSNEFHGSVFGDLTPSFLVSPNSPPSGRNGKALWWYTKPGEGAYDADFGFELGGPIMKDKLWFYVGFSPVLNRTYFDRYVNVNAIDPATGLAKKDPNGNYIQTHAPGSDQIYNSSLTTYQATGKLTYLFNENHNLSLALDALPESNSGVYRDPLYGTFARLDQNQSRFIGDWSSATYDLVANYTGKALDKHLIIEGTAGLHRVTYDADPTTVNGIDQANTDVTIWYPSSIPLSDFESAPAACSAPNSACPVQRYQTGGYGLMDHHTENRIAARGALSYLFEALGQHNAKFGVDYERVNDDIVQNESGNGMGGIWAYGLYGPNTYYTYRNYGTVVNTAYQPGNPLYNYPGIGLTNPNPALGTDFFFNPEHANPVSTSFSLFLQDSWSILSNLTFNYGVRWETQSMSDGLHPDTTSINIDNNIAPRVQIMWDPTNQGRAKISGNWGRFYSMIPVDMGVRSFGAESQVLAAYDCSGMAGGAGAGALGKTPGFSPIGTAGCTPIPQAVTNWQNTPVTMAQAAGVSPVAPNIGGIYTDQFGAAAEYEVISDLSVGIEWQARRLGQTIEDMSSNDGNTYFIANPGVSKPFTTSIPSVQQANPLQATTRDAFTGRQFTLQFPQAQRDYDGVTLHVTKNFSKHWLAQLSYTYSVLRGNYSGPIDPEYNQIDPYITAAFDLPSLMANSQGLLPGDVTHSFRAYGAYTFDLSPRLSVTTGGALRVMSGTPVSIVGAHPLYGPGAAFILPRGEGGRTPTITNLDLSGKMEWVISPPYALRFSIDLFNVLNRQDALLLDPNYTFDSVHPIQNGTCTNKNAVNSANPIASVQADCTDIKYLKTVDGRPVTVNENFGKPLAGYFQFPFSMRVGVALAF